jgi:hypothetical protein
LIWINGYFIKSYGRKNVTSSSDNALQKEAKKLAIDLKRPFNDLIEEVVRGLLIEVRN